MNEIDFIFNKADIKSGLLFMLVGIIFLVVIIKNWDYIIERLGITTRKALHEKEQTETIEKLKEHSEKSDAKMDRMCNCLHELQASVDSLSAQVTAMQEKQDAAEAARIRDRVSQAYHAFRKRGGITAIEKEATIGLIDEYRKYYSENTFVNEIVLPYIMTAPIIEE